MSITDGLKKVIPVDSLFRIYGVDKEDLLAIAEVHSLLGTTQEVTEEEDE